MKWLNPGIWLAILLAIGAASGISYWRGGVNATAAERASWVTKENARITAEQLALFKALEQNERTRQQQEIDNRKVSNAHQAELAAVRAEYERPTGRLRITADVCRDFAVGAETDRATGADASTAGTVALPKPVERDLRSLQREADEVTAAARGLQDWARKNGFAPE